MKHNFFLLALCTIICTSLHAQMGAQGLKTAWIINDDFNNNNNRWYEDSTATYETHVRYNAYGLYNKDTSGRIFVHAFTQTFEKDDYKIEAEIEHASGDDDKGSGLVIGADELLKNYFRFLISNSGDFLIEKITGNTKTSIQDWKYADAIRKNKSNILSIVKFGNRCSFRINDVIVYSGDVVNFFGNKHGFYVSSRSKIYCNTFKIYDITVAKSDPNTPKQNIYNAVFLDYFTDNDNAWSIEDNNDVKISLGADSYVIENKTEGYYMVWQTMPISEVMNHRIEIKAHHKEGVDDRPFGLSFGTKDVNNTYFFCISADGSFLVGEFVDGEFQKVNPWTKNDAIYTNNLATNTLAFEKTDKWYFYINGKLVYSCEPKTYFGNKFGFYVENKQTVEFTTMKLSQVTDLD